MESRGMDRAGAKHFAEPRRSLFFRKDWCPVLVLISRKKFEDVVITVAGQMIVVTLVDLRGDKARIGFTASPEVTINRREVFEAIQRNQTQVPHEPNPTTEVAEPGLRRQL